MKIKKIKNQSNTKDTFSLGFAKEEISPNNLPDILILIFIIIVFVKIIFDFSTTNFYYYTFDWIRTRFDTMTISNFLATVSNFAPICVLFAIKNKKIKMIGSVILSFYFIILFILIFKYSHF